MSQTLRYAVGDPQSNRIGIGVYFGCSVQGRPAWGHPLRTSPLDETIARAVPGSNDAGHRRTMFSNEPSAALLDGCTICNSRARSEEAILSAARRQVIRFFGKCAPSIQDVRGLSERTVASLDPNT